MRTWQVYERMAARILIASELVLLAIAVVVAFAVGLFVGFAVLR